MNLVSWQTRTLATMIAGGYMVEKGGKNPALDYAMKLAIDELDAAFLAQAAEQAPTKKVVHTEPQAGSYERFMMAWGGKLNAAEGEGGFDVFAPKKSSPDSEGGD